MDKFLLNRRFLLNFLKTLDQLESKFQIGSFNFKKIFNDHLQNFHKIFSTIHIYIYIHISITFSRTRRFQSVTKHASGWRQGPDHKFPIKTPSPRFKLSTDSRNGITGGIRLIRELNGFITGSGTNERMKNEQKRTKRVARHNAIGSRTIILYPLCPSPPPSLSLSSLVFLRNQRNTRYSRYEPCKPGVIPWRRGCFYDQLHTRITHVRSKVFPEQSFVSYRHETHDLESRGVLHLLKEFLN